MNNDARILILEDTPTDVELIERELRNAKLSFVATRVETKETFAEALNRFQPDIVLSDYSLPQFNGLEALQMLKESHPTVPFILITGSLTEEIAVLCMKEGADDYILKTSLTRLPSAVANALEKTRIESERINALAALRRSEELYRLIAENTSDLICVIDAQDNFEYASPSHQDVLGHSPAYLLGQSRSSLIHPDDQPPAAWAAARSIASQKPYRLELRLRTREGDWKVFETVGKWIFDAQGQPQRRILVSRDLTERLEAEEALREQVAERNRTEQQLNYLAYYDALTSLPNRTLFRDRLQQALDISQRDEQLIGVLVLSLDRYKAISDTLGSTMAEQLIRRVAQRLTGTTRENDTVAYFGSDEFAFLLTQLRNTEQVVDIAQRMQSTLDGSFNIDGHELYVTSSIGIAMCPHDGRDEETLMNNASAALFKSQEVEGNNYRFYTPGMNATARKRLDLESNLRRALEREEFTVYYQPKIDIGTCRIAGAEALVRWIHPQHGVVSPAEFIPLAEETGLIVPIGNWVFRAACKQVSSWHAEGCPPLDISVNLSARQFQQLNLTHTVLDVLAESELAPHSLELEVTESSLITNAELAGSTLTELREMGIKISLDDFGTGYSSLSYLQRLPLDILKIDRSFIRDVENSPDDAALVKTIITLAHNLRLKVVAEGVETEEQFRLLQKLKCDEVQGFLFSKPVPAKEFRQLLAPSKETLNHWERLRLNLERNDAGTRLMSVA